MDCKFLSQNTFLSHITVTIYHSRFSMCRCFFMYGDTNRWLLKHTSDGTELLSCTNVTNFSYSYFLFVQIMSLTCKLLACLRYKESN